METFKICLQRQEKINKEVKEVKNKKVVINNRLRLKHTILKTVTQFLNLHKHQSKLKKKPLINVPKLTKT